MSPGTHEYDTIPSDGTNFDFRPVYQIEREHQHCRHHYRGDERQHHHRDVA